MWKNDRSESGENVRQGQGNRIDTVYWGLYIEEYTRVSGLHNNMAHKDEWWKGVISKRPKSPENRAFRAKKFFQKR